ncbi:uncharacterized protein LOC108159185 [Drosophila miranda]|uniref:uncharacterized protein LOC108159185 n=1 Tax=Drosophila miranda TaxID=7229 RepID=UPI0007E77731|nr:uncharacterized protein LOC108159185 [Drosophila miranda]
MAYPGDISLVGITSNKGITIAMRSEEFFVYHLGAHIYCCAYDKVFVRKIMSGVRKQLAAKYLDQDQKIPVRKAQQLLWQKYPAIVSAPVLFAGHDYDTNRQYLFAPQKDGIVTNNRFAACGSGRALEQARKWVATKWYRDQSLMESQQMAQMVLKNWDSPQKPFKDVIVLYRRLEDAPTDSDE